MKIIGYFTILPVLFSAFGSALAFADNRYDQCVLQSLRGTRSNIATVMITNACDTLYRNGSFLLPREQSYYGCLLQNLPGIEADNAAQQIGMICNRQNSF